MGAQGMAGFTLSKGYKRSPISGFYIHHFNAIELNATHFKIYTPEAIGKWKTKADGRHFKFCCKFPQIISHYSQFKNTQRLTDALCEGIRAFKEHVGPLFLQVSDKLPPSRKDALFAYLETIPKI